MKLTNEQRVMVFSALDENESASGKTIFNILTSAEPAQVLSALIKPLNRYQIQAGKVFGKSPKDPEKIKILRLVADDVVVQNINTQKVEVLNIDHLLHSLSNKGFKEVSLLDEILHAIKSIIGPVLGAYLTASLTKWIIDQLKS